MKHIYISWIAILLLAPQLSFGVEILAPTITPEMERHLFDYWQAQIQDKAAKEAAQKALDRQMPEVWQKTAKEMTARTEREAARTVARKIAYRKFAEKLAAEKIAEAAAKKTAEKLAQKKFMEQAAKLAARQAAIQGSKTLLMRLLGPLTLLTAPIEAAGICGTAANQLDTLNGALFEAQQQLRQTPNTPENQDFRKQLRDQIDEISGIISDIRGSIRNTWIGSYCNTLGISI